MKRVATIKTMRRFAAAAATMLLLAMIGKPMSTQAAAAERAAAAAELQASTADLSKPVTDASTATITQATISQAAITQAAIDPAAIATSLEQVVEPALAVEQQGPRWGVRFGRGVLYEKTNSTKADVTRLSFLVGADIEWSLAASRIGASLEYNRFSSVDGNQTIQVSKFNETLFTWVDFAFAKEGRFVPYAGAAFGASRLTAETQLAGQAERATGLWLPSAGARIGVLAAWSPSLRFRTDARYETGQDLKTNDARLGVVVSLQYLFSPVISKF